MFGSEVSSTAGEGVGGGAGREGTMCVCVLGVQSYQAPPEMYIYCVQGYIHTDHSKTS